MVRHDRHRVHTKETFSPLTHNILKSMRVLYTKCSANNVSSWRGAETREVFEDKRKRIVQAVGPELKMAYITDLRQA